MAPPVVARKEFFPDAGARAGGSEMDATINPIIPQRGRGATRSKEEDDRAGTRLPDAPKRCAEEATGRGPLENTAGFARVREGG